MKVHRVGLSLVAVATLTAIPALSAHAQVAEPVEAGPTVKADCLAPPGPTLAEDVETVARARGIGRSATLDWLNVPGAARQLERLQALVDASSLVDGYEADLGRQRVVVVSADPGRAAAPSALPSGPLTLKVVAACKDSSSAQAEFAAVKAWVATKHAASDVGASVEVDVSTGRTVVTLAGGSVDAFAATLSEAFPQVAIKRVSGEFQNNFGRFDSESPHRGGARISVDGRPPCTAGFRLVERYNGRPWMLTAAHCQLGSVQKSVLTVSGRYFGTTKYNVQFSNNLDLMLIGASSQTYSSRLHLDPDTYDRTAVGSYDVPLYGSSCVNGSTTLAHCGLVVDARDIWFCPPDGFCRHTDRLIRPGYVAPWEGGDSGGALYGKNTSTTVNVRGIVSGSLPLPGTGFGFFTPIRYIQGVYGGGFNLP